MWMKDMILQQTMMEKREEDAIIHHAVNVIKWKKLYSYILCFWTAKFNIVIYFRINALQKLY